MQAYSPLSRRARAVAGAFAVIASSVVLGGQLSLFHMANQEGLVAQARVSKAPMLAKQSASQPVPPAALPMTGRAHQPG